jgi:hypothetical protein
MHVYIIQGIKAEKVLPAELWMDCTEVDRAGNK